MHRTLTRRERDRTFSSCVCVVVILAERADSVLSNEAGEESSFCEGHVLARRQMGLGEEQRTPQGQKDTILSPSLPSTD